MLESPEGSHPLVTKYPASVQYFTHLHQRTPLVALPLTVFAGESSAEHFIEVESIKVAGKEVSLNASFLFISKKGNGGTKISSVTPYTILETSIYKVITNAFRRVLGTTVAPAAPFKTCFSSKSFGFTSVGPAVPLIELMLQGTNGGLWTMICSNSMVKVKDEVWCLGFIDGGLNPRTSIVIGGHQMEDIFLEFDTLKERLGVSSSLHFRDITCGNFNSTLIT